MSNNNTQGSEGSLKRQLSPTHVWGIAVGLVFYAKQRRFFSEKD